MRTIPREVCSTIDKASFTLSELQEQVLIGTLLGDGGLRPKGKDCRLHIKHGIGQLPLVEYKRRIFSDISTMGISVFHQTIGKSDYTFAEFVTRTHPEFTRYYRLFYSSRKKVIPHNIHQLLTHPICLAVWFMDDGSAEYAGASLQTHCFTKEEVDRLINTLKQNFNIDATKRLNKAKWIIYIPKASMPKLQRAVQPYMLADLQYKLMPYSIRQNKPRRDYMPGSGFRNRIMI